MLKSLLVLFCLFSSLRGFSQNGYQTKTNDSDHYIDWMKGFRNYVFYTETDFDTGKVLVKKSIDFQIYINFQRKYIDDNYGTGIITFYSLNKSVKLFFDSVHYEDDRFVFYKNSIAFATYIPKDKIFFTLDKTSRIYKWFYAE